MTNGFDKLFQLELGYDLLNSHRRKVGIEGTWEAYFNLLLMAISAPDGCKITVQESPVLKASAAINRRNSAEMAHFS